MKKLISILLLTLVLVPMVMSGDKFKVDVTMTPIVEKKQEKKIYEDNPLFWIALIATIVAVLTYSYIFYKKYK